MYQMNFKVLFHFPQLLKPSFVFGHGLVTAL